MKNDLQFRMATADDTGLILYFIKALADYENKLDEVVATKEGLWEWIFEKKIAEVFFAVLDGQEVGFALYFYNFSTFSGKAGLYLEDLFVLPAYRGKGVGTGVFRQLARIALDRGCGKIHWTCLKWNQPGIDFYLSLGAQAWMSGRSTA